MREIKNWNDAIVEIQELIDLTDKLKKRIMQFQEALYFVNIKDDLITGKIDIDSLANEQTIILRNELAMIRVVLSKKPNVL
jgi:hypothetical protein